MRHLPCPTAALALAAALASQKVPSPPVTKTVETCSALVRVVDRYGGPVPNYRLQVLGAADTRREVEPGVLHGDRYLLEHLPAGELSLRIDAVGFARTVSARFTTAAGSVPDITVTLTHGGRIEGTVLDADGAPLANATVHTDAVVERPRGDRDFVGQLLVARATTSSATATTDDHGHYRLDLLAPGAYAVRIHHDAFCDALVRDLHVAIGSTEAAGVARLQRGAVVEGTAHMPAGDVFVCVEVYALRDDARGELLVDTDCGPDGHFRLQQRLRPGRYEVVTRWGPGSDSTAPFIVSDSAHRGTRVTVPDQDRLTLELDVRR